MKNTLVLTILDGFGISSVDGNAIKNARTPNIDALFASNPTTQIHASGENVGLPEGQMGNSEVGHTNIGAGRIVYQDLTRINKSIENKTFFENKPLLKAINNAKENNTYLHIIGLLSDGGVHSLIDHLYAIIELSKKNRLFKVFIHAIMDGRDTSPTSGKGFIRDCEKKLSELGVGKIATVIGRYYAMDRDNRWDRVEEAYNAIVLRKGIKSDTPEGAIDKSYSIEITDEFIKPTIISNGPGVQKNDSIIFFNFRPDRARELTKAFVDNTFEHFDRKKISPIVYTCMTQYDPSITNVEVAFHAENLRNTFGEYVSNLGLSQLRIAETEKYAHVTFFFNGGKETPYPNEERIIVQSPKVSTYDLKPEMSAIEVTERVTKCIKDGNFDVIILNLANCDMVGHTGLFKAAVKAVETVDFCVKQIYEAVKSVNGCLIITADHGNAEKMFDDNGNPFTAHTTNPVPFCIIDKKFHSIRENGKLCDIAPTMLKLLNIPKPNEMNGDSIII